MEALLSDNNALFLPERESADNIVRTSRKAWGANDFFRNVTSSVSRACFFHLGSPLLAQESAEQPLGVGEPGAAYLEQTQPEILDWIRTSAPDAVTRELQVEVASTIIRLFESDQLAPFLSYLGGIGTDDLVPLLTEPGGPLTKLTSDVSIGAVKGLMVDVGSELAAEAIFQAPVLRDTPDAFRDPLEIALGAALKETLSIVTHDGPLETLVLKKVLERAQDAIEIYQATGALAKAESGALIATALMVSSAAEIGVEIGGERGQRLIDLARRDIAPVMPAAVGNDDAEIVTAIYSAALDALVAYHRGDIETASSAYQAVLQAAGDSNLGPLSLLRNPLDWGVAAMNLGKDSPEIALEVLLAATELAAVGRGEVKSVETSPVLPPDNGQRPALASAMRSPLGEATLNISAGFFDTSYPGAWNPPAQHLGSDLPAPEGTQVVSPVAGTILLNRTGRADAFEKYLIVRSATGDQEHVFGHINSSLSEGDEVEIGTPLGTIVSAGTGSHVHWGINTAGVLESLGSGWGWGRAPLSATVEQAADRGWIDPAEWFAATSNVESVPETFAPAEWGPTIIPGPGVELGYRPCGDRTDIRRCLEEKGLSADAIDFSFAVAGDLVGEVFAIDFQEAGEIDVAHVEFNGASPHQWPVLVNGSVGEVALETTNSLSAVFTDPTSQKMLQRFPQATARSAQIRSHRLLEDGTQRFVLVETIIDGCRACPILGTAVTFLEIGPMTGGALRRTPIGLSLEYPSNSVDLSDRVLRERPDSLQTMLNILGYNAGEMDGYPGPLTRNALMNFQAEYCLAATGQPDQGTTTAIIDASGFDVPCMGQKPPEGVSAITPLLAGMYVDDLSFCDLENIPADNSGTSHLSQLVVRGNAITWGHEGLCTIERTDIRNAVTLFRGTCYEADHVTDSRWRFDVLANDRLVDLDMPTAADGFPPRTYIKCPDNSVLRQNWSAWFGEETDVSARDTEELGSTDFFEPARGTTERRAILDAVRPIAVRHFGPPVEFVVYTLRVLDGQAYVELLAQRPGGGPIDLAATPAAARGEVDFGVGNGDIVSGFLVEEAGVWKPRDIVVQATEAWWIGNCNGLGQLMPETCGEADNALAGTSQNGSNSILETCTPTGNPSFPQRMMPEEDSSTHTGRTMSGNNWTLRLFSPGSAFGVAEFTNSAGTTAEGFWRPTRTGICQSYNGRESWSCHDILACQGETDRFAMRNSEGEFTSVLQASVGPSFELGAATTREPATSTPAPPVSPAISHERPNNSSNFGQTATVARQNPIARPIGDLSSTDRTGRVQETPSVRLNQINPIQLGKVTHTLFPLGKNLELAHLQKFQDIHSRQDWRQPLLILDRIHALKKLDDNFYGIRCMPANSAALVFRDVPANEYLSFIGSISGVLGTSGNPLETPEYQDISPYINLGWQEPLREFQKKLGAVRFALMQGNNLAYVTYSGSRGDAKAPDAVSMTVKVQTIEKGCPGKGPDILTDFYNVESIESIFEQGNTAEVQFIVAKNIISDVPSRVDLGNHPVFSSEVAATVRGGKPATIAIDGVEGGNVMTAIFRKADDGWRLWSVDK